MAQDKRIVEFSITKNRATGRPSVNVAVPAGTNFKDLIRVQEILYTDILDRIGLESHPACLSGLDAIIMGEQFEDVIRVGF